MKARVEKNNNDTNYYFLLKCLAGVAAVALVTTVAVGAYLLKAGAVGAAGLAVGSATATAAAAAPFILGPLLLLALGAACFLPFLLCSSGGSGYSNTYVRTTPYYGSSTYVSSPAFFTPSVFSSGNYHGHSGYGGTVHVHGSGPFHGHPSGGDHVHGHTSGPGNVHGHR